jgi:hypothetical protein
LGSGCAARARARADDASDVTQTQGRVICFYVFFYVL